jgi:hypothetical protein
MSTEHNNIISAERDSAFQQLNIKNIVVEPPKTSANQGQKGVWVNIKYMFQNGEKKKFDKLKIQSPDLFSYGISRYEDTSPAKMSFSMINRKQREIPTEDHTENDLLDIQIEDDTIKILEDITKKIKEHMLEPEMIKALGRQRDKKWQSNVDNMEIVKRKEQENGIDAVYVYAKVVETNNFMKTKFMLIKQDEEENITVKDLDQAETINKLLQKDVNCKATAMFVIDSVFVGKEPYLQVKLSEVLISEFIELKNKRSIIVPDRFRNRSHEKKQTKALYDEDSSDEEEKPQIRKKIISQDKDGSDSDSD